MSKPKFNPNPFTDMVPRRGATSSRAGLDTYRRIAGLEQALGSSSTVDTDALNLYRTMNSTLKTYSYDPNRITTAAEYKLTIADSTVYISAMYLPTPATITGVLTYTVTAGVGTWTTGKAAIYNAFGSRLAISNNSTTIWKSLGLNQIPMSSTVSLDRGIYYTAIINVRSVTTTAPQIAGIPGYVDLQNILTASGFPRTAALAAQSDLNDNQTFSSYTVGDNNRWMGLY